MSFFPVYISYVAYFRDQAEYDAAIGVYGDDYILITPVDLAAALGITIIPGGGPIEPKGILNGNSHFVSVIFVGTGSQDIFIDNSVLETPVVDPGVSAHPVFTWSARIVKIGAEAGPDPSPPTTIPQRRWGMGFELAQVGEGGTGLNPARAGCRDASRVVDGLGWAFRGETGITLTRTLDEYQTGYTSRVSWERFYIRIRTLPGANTQWWRTSGATSPTAGLRFVINTTGTTGLINVNAASATTLTQNGATVLNLNQWYKIDILSRYNDGSNNGLGRLYINGVLEVTLPVLIGSGGLGQAQFHLSSIMGDVAGGGTTLNIDVDDWDGSEIPNQGGVEFLDSLDWLTGTHYRKTFVVSAAGDNAGWTPSQVQSMNQMISPLASSATARYASSTALARLHAITELTDLIEDITGFNFGVVAAVIGLYGSRNGTADGQLGYSINGTVTLATIVQNVATIFNSRMYRPTGMTTPDSILPFGVVHDKANSVDSSAILGVQAVIGYIGTWGPEDDPDFLVYTPIVHNAPYYNTPLAVSGPEPYLPAGAFGGTYVGNGTTQDIELLLPIHFLWIRPLAGGNGGVKWHSTGLGAHLGGTDRVVPDFAIRVFVDFTTDPAVPKFTVAGNDSQINQSAVTYQWIAFADPGMRYCTNGAFRWPPGSATAVNPIIDATFTPVWAWTQSENLNVAGSTVVSAVKGPGDAANVGTELDGTSLANYMTFGVGQITSRASLHLTSSQMNYSLWRAIDGSGEVAVQIITYTGNGVSPRAIPLTPVSGRFPLFAYVQPANAQGFFRDPSHAGANSSSFDLLTSSATAIMAGAIDEITVGATLNAGGVVYNVFVLPGDDAGWNNGDFPIPDGPQPDDVWPDIPIPPPVGLTIIPDGGIIFNGSPAMLLLANISGIYTLVENKRNDTLIDRQPGQTEIDVKIPNPTGKTGYIGG